MIEPVSPTSTNAELKMAIDRLNRKLEYLYRHLGVVYPDESVPIYVLEAQELVRQGRDSEAVKIIREQTAVGIIEARAIIEDMATRMGRRSSVEPEPTATTASYAEQAEVDAAWRAAVRASR